jgi:hypothetical protein
MATVARLVDAPVDAVASVLADPRTYDRVVVGSKRIRWFDPRWPEPGTRFHHSIGLGLLHIRDDTTVMADELPARLRLSAGLGPLGAAEVVFTLTAAERGTRVEMAEHPTSGLLRAVWSPPVAAAMRARNAVSLGRLEDLARARAEVRRRAVGQPTG